MSEQMNSRADDPATRFHNAYPVCSRIRPELAPLLGSNGLLSEYLEENPETGGKTPYLADLAKVEEAAARVSRSMPEGTEKETGPGVNPALELISVNWQGLGDLRFDPQRMPVAGKGFVVVWIPPGADRVQIRDAAAQDLLALKIVAEEIDPWQAADEGGVSVGAIENLLLRARRQGLIRVPSSRITRPADFAVQAEAYPEHLSSPTFTLQWHLTQACDLNCRHCYDRTDRTEMPLPRAIDVLDSLYAFCREHHVFGQVTFTGGNPLLYPHFDRLYQEAASRGFMTAVLGNPMPRHRIEKMLSAQMPEFYQVSLEGTRQHNDYIRGAGHFDRTLDFLALLGELGVYRMVMLTLTRDNMDQVTELGKQLRGRTERFTFNRLAAVGQGARLAAVPPADFPAFLAKYMEVAEEEPHFGLKDNLLNLLRYEKGLSTGDGCAGYGCGAAFNFVAVLPDGEVHACRKMPSPIGNIRHASLSTIYHGDVAERYRHGSVACAGCRIRPVCGACLAVSYGFGNDIFQAPDPYCFERSFKNQARSAK